MKLNIIGRQMEVTEDLKQLLNKKLSKFDKFFKDDAVAAATLSRKHSKEIIEIMISSSGTLFRAEEEAATFNNALDEAIESIERQIRKNKTRLEKRLREGAFVKETADDHTDVEEEMGFDVRVKTFAIKAMTPDEAILQMNLLSHEFFVFENSATGKVNVVYKRKDGGYGQIVPMN